MDRKACAILMIPLLAAGLLSTCFNPDYGDGGFLCNHGSQNCPDGYQCLLDEGQMRCVKGPKAQDMGPGQDIPPPPLDMPPWDRTPQDGPVSDQGIPVLACSGGVNRTFAGVLKGPQSFDLVVDNYHQLHAVFIDSSGYLRVMYPDGVKSWSASKQNGQVKAALVAGGVDNENRVHVVYADEKKALRAATIKTAGMGNGLWSVQPKKVHDFLEVMSVDLDRNRSPYEYLYYVAHGLDTTRSNKPQLIIGRVTAKFDSFTYNNFCDTNPADMQYPRVAAWTTSGKASDHGGVSFFLKSSGYQFGYFDRSTSSCPPFTQYVMKGTPTPAPLAMDTANNKIQISLSTQVTGFASLEADLNYASWDGVSTSPIVPQPLLKKAVVDPLSVHMATHAATNLTCLAFFMLKADKGRALRIICRSPTKSQWAISNAFADISMLDYQNMHSRQATGVRLDLGRGSTPEVHLAYVTPGTATNYSLKYFSCTPK